MTHPTVYDLTRLAAALEATGDHPDLVVAIRRAADVSSAHRDLHEALLALRPLRRLTRGGDDTALADEDLATIVGSLMTTAIILYSRATHTKPIGRRPWFGDGKLPPDLREVHRELTRLRDKEVAHFGKGEHVDGAPLLEDALVLRPFDRAHPVGYLTSRMLNRAGLARRAERLAETVSGLAVDAVNARYTELHRILSRLAAARDPVMQRLRGMPLDDARLLSVEASSRSGAAQTGGVRNFSGVSVVEIHDDDMPG